MYFVKSPGIRDKLSASMLIFPGLYLISKSKSDSSKTHCSHVAFSFAVDKTYVRGLLSV